MAARSEGSRRRAEKSGLALQPIAQQRRSFDRRLAPTYDVGEIADAFHREQRARLVRRREYRTRAGVDHRIADLVRRKRRARGHNARRNPSSRSPHTRGPNRPESCVLTSALVWSCAECLIQSQAWRNTALSTSRRAFCLSQGSSRSPIAPGELDQGSGIAPSSRPTRRTSGQ